MLVIADSSPLIALVNVGQIDILPSLFKSAVIPPTVASELASQLRPEPVREFIASPPAWLLIQAPHVLERIPGIHVGEQEAISLAQELKADLLIIDDREGRKAALRRNIRTARTIAVLEQAAIAGLIDLEMVLGRLRTTDFRVPKPLLDEVLLRHRRRTEERKPN